MKTEEGNNSLDTIIKQAIGKEPFLSFSRASDSPVQWIQLLHALDQQDVPGWPLLSPLKVQLQKCDKCSREFCSPINYRRHLRVHHRLKKLDKDSIKDRELLRAYWDKLPLEEAKEAISLKNAMLEEVPGSSVIKALTGLIRKPGFSSLPQYYLKAGAAILDLIQARPSRFPISSQELFSILDDASEKTFLCGAASSMQKYIFDGEAGKIGLETKNLIACVSFLVEQKLVKEWLADKDAEAMRFQKMLVEEEEEAQKRRTELLEKKRRKKLRLKEQKAKDKRYVDNAESKDGISSTEGSVSPAEACSPLAIHFHEANPPDNLLDQFSSSLNACQCPKTDKVEHSEPQSGFSSEFADHSSTTANIDKQTVERHVRQRLSVSRQQVLPKSKWNATSGYHTNNTSQISKHGVTNKSGLRGQRLTAPVINGYRVWSRKSKTGMNETISQARAQTEQNTRLDQVKNGEVLIGPISVVPGNCCQPEGNPAESRDKSMVENLARQDNIQEKPAKTDFLQSGTNRSIIKLWRPVSRQDLKETTSENDETEADKDCIGGKGGDKMLPEDFRSSYTDDNENTPAEDSLNPRILGFSSLTAKAFLVRKWEEAISSNHVKLVLTPISETSGLFELENHEQKSSCSSCDALEILDSAENGLVALDGTSSAANKSKVSMMRDEGVKVKYIPKQKTDK